MFTFLFSGKVTSDNSDSSSATESDLSTGSVSSVSYLLASPYDVSDSSFDRDSTEVDGFLYTALKALFSSSCNLLNFAELLLDCCYWILSKYQVSSW